MIDLSSETKPQTKSAIVVPVWSVTSVSKFKIHRVNSIQKDDNSLPLNDFPLSVLTNFANIAPQPGIFDVDVIESSKKITRTPICVSSSSLKQLAERCPNLRILNLANCTVINDVYFTDVGLYSSTMQHVPESYWTQKNAVY
ncbi:hypothetical protein HK096_008615 [Nowakowskiella sp. JEL0078]|nr:hypothetical protein HK096_008615 [Nowakowskiella sp. JEL0078]